MADVIRLPLAPVPNRAGRSTDAHVIEFARTEEC